MRNSTKRHKFADTSPLPSTDVFMWQSRVLAQTNLLVGWVQPWAAFGKSASGASNEPLTMRLPPMLQTPAFVSDAVTRDHAARKAKGALDEYIAWCEAFVAAYERDLQAKAMARPGRVRQARAGLEKLRGIPKRLTVHSEEQTAQFERILKGYMQMDQYTTGPEARSALIPILVNDVIKSLSKAKLIAERAPQTLTPTLRPSLAVNPQQVIAA